MFWILNDVIRTATRTNTEETWRDREARYRRRGRWTDEDRREDLARRSHLDRGYW